MLITFYDNNQYIFLFMHINTFLILEIIYIAVDVYIESDMKFKYLNDYKKDKYALYAYDIDMSGCCYT